MQEIQDNVCNTENGTGKPEVIRVATNDDKLTTLLFGQDGFQPTAIMCRVAVDYIRQETDLSPMQILEKQGHMRQNWYFWQRDHAEFMPWWNRVIEDIFKQEYLSGMYLQLLKRARTHDTGAAKLIAQRFDPKYTERTQQDQRHVFAGYEPALADESRERQRKIMAEQDIQPALPGTAEHAQSYAELRRQAQAVQQGTGQPMTADTGGVATYCTPGNTTHTQTSSEPETGARQGQDNDVSMDLEQETGVAPPGGPLGG